MNASTTVTRASAIPAHVNHRFLAELTTLRGAIDNLIADAQTHGYDEERPAYIAYLRADYAVNEQIELWDRARGLDTHDPDAALYAAADRGYDDAREALVLSLVWEG